METSSYVVQIVIETPEGDQITLGESKRKQVAEFVTQLFSKKKQVSEEAKLPLEMGVPEKKKSGRTKGFHKPLGNRTWTEGEEKRVYDTLAGIPLRLPSGRWNPMRKRTVMMLAQNLGRTTMSIESRFSALKSKKAAETAKEPMTQEGLIATQHSS